MPVRSQRLAFGLVGTANVNETVYTCPSGTVTIVRSIRLANQQSPTTLNYRVRFTSGAGGGPVTYGVILPQASAPPDEAWSVLEAGDTITLRSDVASALQYWISGAELVV